MKYNNNVSYADDDVSIHDGETAMTLGCVVCAVCVCGDTRLKWDKNLFIESNNNDDEKLYGCIVMYTC